eukprot:g8080.t1
MGDKSDFTIPPMETSVSKVVPSKATLKKKTSAKVHPEKKGKSSVRSRSRKEHGKKIRKARKTITQRVANFMYGHHIQEKLRHGQVVPNWIVVPGSRVDQLHTISMLVLVLYSLYVTPYYWAFGMERETSTAAWEIFVEVSFIFDIVLQFRISYHDPDADFRLEFSSRKIAEKYFRSYFIYDVLGSLPWDTISFMMGTGMQEDDSWSSFITIASGMKLLRILRMKRWFVSNPQSAINKSYIFGLFIVFILFTHYIACLWYAVVSSDISSKHNWYYNEHDKLLISDGKTKLYIASMYSMLSIILGDNIAPQKNHYWISFIIVFGGSIFFATLMGSVTAYISKLDDGRAEFNEQLKDLQDSMAYVNMPPQLREKVLAFYQYTYERYRGQDLALFFKGEKSKIQLSHSLYSEVIMCLHAGTVYNCPLFDNSNPRFIFHVVSCLKLQLAVPEEKIVEKGDEAEMMYFIARGEVVCVDETETILAVIKAGEYFGEVALALGGQRMHTIVAQTYVELQTFSRRDWEDAVKDFPVETAKIIKIAMEHKSRGGLNLEQEFEDCDGGAGGQSKKNFKKLWKVGIKKVIGNVSKQTETLRLGSSKKRLRHLHSKRRNELSEVSRGTVDKTKLKKIISTAVQAEMETLENELRKSFVYKELESKERDEGVIVT